MNRLLLLREHGQSPWLDFIQRGLLQSGGLRRLIADDGIAGVTSNPAIFEKAITGSDDYLAQIGELRAQGLDSVQIYERLAIEDIRRAADELRPVYGATSKRDGYVSLEVSPHLARDTGATLADARRLWRDVERPNLMIKVPGTAEGMPAIEALIAEGVNVNVTLLFSRGAWRDAAEAWLRGIERRAASGADIAGVASVASFFVSRIDTRIDAALHTRLAHAHWNDRLRIAALCGRAAVANARLAYRDFRQLTSEARWRRLAAQGAMPQRLLWASTGTKNPAYRDVVYVEELIGDQTVNTLPLPTLEAFRDHGVARASLDTPVAAAEALLRDIENEGIAFERVTAEFLDEGLLLFERSYDALLAAVARAPNARPQTNF